MAKAIIITAKGDCFMAETMDVPLFLQKKVFWSAPKMKVSSLTKPVIRSGQLEDNIAATM